MNINNKTQVNAHIQASFQLDFSSFSLDVDLILPSCGVTALFGRSGSGKTTLLRCIAGLEKAKGRLVINDEIWQNEKIFIPTHKRPIGYVFQEANLFPHLTVIKNLHYGIKRVTKHSVKVSLEHAIELLDIEHILDRKPAKLSGGEKQRVAIARALALSPRLLLMDEPLSALDIARKQEILPFLERLHNELEIPILYVTHSPNEVARLADYLVVMVEGKAIASGNLTETLARIDLPIRLGEEASVVLEAKIIKRELDWHLALVEFTGGQLWVRDMDIPVGCTIRLRILARDVSISLEKQTSSILNILPAVVTDIQEGEHEAVNMIQVQLDKTLILARLTKRSVKNLNLNIGSSIWIQIKSVAIIE